MNVYVRFNAVMYVYTYIGVNKSHCSGCVGYNARELLAS